METVAAQTPFQQTQLPDLSFNARQLSRVGEALGNVASEFGRRERETVLLEAQRDINDWRNGIFNPDSGVLREEGGNAIGATDRTIANAEQFAGIMEQRYGSRLGPSGQLALRTLLQQETQSVATRVISHETGQRREYEVTLLQANIEDALDQITSNPTNDEVFNQQVGRILTSTTQASVLSGETGTELGSPAGNRQQEALTAAVGARVAALAGPQFRQPGAAMSLLEEYSDQIDPDTYAELYPQIREANINQRALSEAEAAAITERTGIAPMFVPQAGNASAGGAQIVDYNGMPLAVVQGTNPLIGSLDGASRLTNPDAAVTMDEMLRGPFMVLQRRLGRTLVIRDAIARAGTSREAETPGSQHFSGAALDIDITNMNYQERLMLVQEAMQLGFRGFGFGNGTMHIDMREGDGPTIWTYAGHEAGWNGLNEVQLRALTSGMQQGSWSPTTAAATGADYISSITDPEVRARAQEAYVADIRFQDAMQSRERAQILRDIYGQVEIDYRAQQEGSGALGDVATYLTPERIGALGTDAAAARRYIEQVRSGAERVTDQAVYNDLFMRLTSPVSAVRSAAANDYGALLAAQPNLSNQDFRQLQTMQQSLRGEIAGATTETEAARSVNAVMGLATMSRINSIMPDIVRGASLLAGRVEDSVRRAEIEAGMQANASELIRAQLRAELANMTDTQRQALIDDNTLLDDRIANITRQLMQDVDITSIDETDDASFLEIITTIEQQEGFTVEQLFGSDTQLTIPISALPEPLQFTGEELRAVYNSLTTANGGIPPSPPRLIEAVYNAARAELAGPQGMANLAGLFGVAPAAEAAVAAVTERSQMLQTGSVMGMLYEAPAPTEMPGPTLSESLLFNAEPMRPADVDREFMSWFNTMTPDPDALALRPAQAYNYALYLNQQLQILDTPTEQASGQRETVQLTEAHIRALVMATPLYRTLEDSEQRQLMQNLSGVAGLSGQQLAIDELIRLLNASRMP